MRKATSALFWAATTVVSALGGWQLTYLLNKRAKPPIATPVVEHRVQYYLMEDAHGTVCVRADSNWRGDFSVYCTPVVAEAVELADRLNGKMAKGGARNAPTQ